MTPELSIAIPQLRWKKEGIHWEAEHEGYQLTVMGIRDSDDLQILVDPDEESRISCVPFKGSWAQAKKVAAGVMAVHMAMSASKSRKKG